MSSRVEELLAAAVDGSGTDGLDPPQSRNEKLLFALNNKLSEEIATETESKVSAHNTGTDAHSDIRLLIQGLTDRLNALADSDDTTLDQLSEVVAYIKSNRDLISATTTSKVNVADIVDNLTTNVSNKPLSAAQGVALKALIDAITVPDKLPNPNALTFTGAVTGTYDGSEPLNVEIPSGGGGTDNTYSAEYTISEDVSQFVANLPESLSYVELYVQRGGGATDPTVSGIQAVIDGYRCNAVGSNLSGSIGYICKSFNKGQNYWRYMKVAYFSENNSESVRFGGNLLRYNDNRENCIIINGSLLAKNVVTIKAR